MKSNITHFTIERSKMPIVLVRSSEIANHTSISVNSVMVGRNCPSSAPLNTINNLRNTKGINIAYKNILGLIVTLPLPDELTLWLTRYLQNNNLVDAEDDCKGFVEKVYGLEEMSNMMQGMKGFSRWRKMSAWDALLLIDVTSKDGEENGFDNGQFHYAICLGNDFYLSKMGKYGRVVISTLKDLTDIYPYSHRFSLRPSFLG